jgi:hypothetical protein
LGETHDAEEHAEEQGEMTHGDFGTHDPLTVRTDVTAEAGADTAEPTTGVDESPEVENREGDGGQGEEDVGWGFPMKPVKKKKEKGGNTGAGAGAGASTPAVQGGGASGGGEKEEWATSGKKKKGKRK